MSEREQFLNGKIKELEIERSEGVSLERLEVINREVSFHKAELEQIEASKQQREEIIAGPQDPDSSFTMTVGEHTVDFRAEAANEASYQALRIVTQLKLQELEQQNQAEIKALRSSWEIERRQFEMQIDSLEEAKSSAQFGEENFKQANQVLADQLHDANLQNADLERKRSIAASEIDSLKAQVEELRNQVSKPNVPTNLDSGALAEAMRIAKEAKPRIYNKRDGDLKGSFFLANLVETGEEINIPWMRIGQYREVSAEEAARFQLESEANKADVPEIAEPVESDLVVEEATIEVPTFREVQDALAIDSMVEHTAERQDVPDGSGGTVETFEQAVERRLNRIEAYLFTPTTARQEVA